MTPGLDILNTGHGHMEISFDKGDPMELERAKRIIADMLRRGYVLFIEGEDKALIRVEHFDPEKGVYIIADGPLYAGDQAEVVTHAESVPATPRRRGRPPKSVAVPMEKVRATAIGRSAGG